MKEELASNMILQSNSVPFSDEDEGGLQLGQVLATLRRRIPLILGVTIAVAALAQFRAMSEKPIYTGEFELLTESVTVETEVISTVSETLTSRQQNQIIIDDTKIKVLLSPTILNPVVEELEDKHPDISYGLLRSSLSIRVTGRDILAVSFTHGDPALVTDVLEAVSDAYLDFSLEERQRDIRQGIAFVEEQLPVLEARVSELQQELQTFRQTYNLIDPEQRAQQLSEQAGALLQQQLTTQTQLNETRLLYSELQNEFAQQSAETAVSSSLNSNSRYQQLLSQLLAIDTQIAQESTLYLDNSVEIQVLQEQRQNLLPLLQREGIRVQRELAGQIRELENREQALAQGIEDINNQIKELSVITREYTDIQRQFKIANDNLEQFLASREGLRIDAAQRQVPWQVLTAPGEPSASASNVKRSLMLGVVLGLLMGTGIALAIDKLSNVIRSPKEIKDVTRLPLLGVIPVNDYLDQPDTSEDMTHWFQSALKMGVRVNQVSDNKVTIPFLEAFRSLYANLRMISPDRPIRSVVISSPTPNNGKTTIAIHLAKAAAGMGQRVLLVDTDLRRPSIYRYMNLVQSMGLTDAISADINPLDIAQPVSSDPNLLVLTAGTIPPDPTRILSSQALKNMIAKGREQFDLIIFDAPPLLGLADAVLLSSCTDGLLLVARMNLLKRSLLEQSMEQLRVGAVSVLGTVANSTEENTINSYIYYYSHPEVNGASAPASVPAHLTQPLEKVREAVSKLRERIKF